MKRHIVIIQGHPERETRHLGHALADAYERGAIAGGHEMRRIDVAALDFPLVHSRQQWEQAPPAAIQEAQKSIAWADHICIIHPLWLGSMPALLKGFLEQVLRTSMIGNVEGRGPGRKIQWVARMQALGAAAR